MTNKVVVPTLDLRQDPIFDVCWLGFDEQKLLIQRCLECGRCRYPPRHHCPQCFGNAFEWTNQSGNAVVHSWCTTVHPPRHEWSDLIPFTLVLAEFSNRVRVLGPLTDRRPQPIKIGARVELEFSAFFDTNRIPCFRRDEVEA